MLSIWMERRGQILFGTLFGAWLGGFYAFCSLAVNWIALPGIPLAAPDGGVQGFILRYALLGAVLGLFTSIPASTWAGVVLGGIVGALISSAVSVASQWGDAAVIRTIIVLLYTFFPLAVILMPIAYAIRRGLDAQVVDPDRPYLWARRYLVPLLLTLVVLGLAALSLYSSDVRRAFRQNHEIVTAALQTKSKAELPQSLREVQGFRENAVPEYEMYYSENAEEFMGPRPAADESSQFLIYTQFASGYRIACVYSSATSVPNCTNQ